MGIPQKAIQIIDKKLTENDYIPMLYDYLHLGVLYLETNQLEKAQKAFEVQIQLNENIAENYFYLAKVEINLEIWKQAKADLEKAKRLYEEGNRMFDSYTHPMDSIYLAQIEEELKLIP